MSKQIYTVFACDEWKSRDSMRLLMATTSIRKLKSFIVRKIGDETFTYDKGNELLMSFRRPFSKSILNSFTC